MVASTSAPPGEEISTFLAPPAMCAPAFAFEVNKPVHSITTSTFSADHGSFAGSRSANTLIRSPLTIKSPASTATSKGKRPCAVSYCSRCALVSASPKSLIATISNSPLRPLSNSARAMLRPIRPKPLIAILIAIVWLQGLRKDRDCAFLAAVSHPSNALVGRLRCPNVYAQLTMAILNSPCSGNRPLSTTPILNTVLIVCRVDSSCTDLSGRARC